MSLCQNRVSFQKMKKAEVEIAGSHTIDTGFGIRICDILSWNERETVVLFTFRIISSYFWIFFSCFLIMPPTSPVNIVNKPSDSTEARKCTWVAIERSVVTASADRVAVVPARSTPTKLACTAGVNGLVTKMPPSRLRNPASAVRGLIGSCRARLPKISTSTVPGSC